MEAFLSALGSLTATSLFALVFMGVSIAFFVYYWFAVSPRKGTLEWISMRSAKPPRLTFALERYPVRRADILPMLLITAVYACTAFFRLGNLENVQSSAILTEGQTVAFSLSEAADVAEIRSFTSLGTGSYTLQYSADGESWCSVELDQRYISVLRWQTAETEDENGDNVPVSLTGKFFILTAHPDPNAAHPSREFLELTELALLDEGGALLTVSHVDEGGEALFDEQELVEEYFWTNSSYFDEIYHPRTAKENIGNVYPYEVSHPPLGKLIISLGIRMFGATPFGWRFMGTLFGVLMLPLLYVFLKNMFGRTAVATCGTILFASEFMHLSQTRIATIDTYGVFFILAMYYFMYRWLTTPPDGGVKKGAPSLFLCGLMFGLGVASKWTVLYGGVGLAVLWAIGLILKNREWQRGKKQKKLPEDVPFRGFFWRTTGLCVVFFAVIPVLIYVLSYIPYAAADGVTSLSGLLGIVWDNQVFMLTYHQGVNSTHAYASRWYHWLFDLKPILYFRETGMEEGMRAAISSFNNPLIAWGGLLCVVLTAIETFRRRCGKALFLLIGYLAQFLPWVFIDRTTFAYHYFPSILFCVMAIAYAMDHILARRQKYCRLAVYGFTGCSVGLYAAFYPVLIGLFVPTSYVTAFLRWLPKWYI